jgi:thioredoxin 1
MSESDELEEIRKEKLESLKGADGETAEPDAQAAPTEPIHVESAEHLQEIADTYGVVLADFYADWCGPCKMIEPIVEELAADTEAAVAKVDVDAHQQLAAQYRVQGVPTLMLFSDGEAVERLTGVRDQTTLEDLIQQYS